MFRMKSRVLASAIVAGAVMMGASSAGIAASVGATVLKERAAVMKSLAAHLGGIKAALGAKNGKAIAMHATAVSQLAAVMPNFFPKGSGPEAGKTRALPKIWQEWDGFVKGANTLSTEAATLAKVAAGGDMGATGAQFGKMAKLGCGGCHKPYRAPKN